MQPARPSGKAASSPGLVQHRTGRAGGVTCSKGELGEALEKTILVAGGPRQVNRPIAPGSYGVFAIRVL